MSQPSDLPKTLPIKTVFRIRWPTGKPGLRETYDEAKLDEERGVYVVGCGYGPHGQTFFPEQVVWDEAEAAECKRKIRIAEDEVR